jgi:hypothetical protein
VKHVIGGSRQSLLASSVLIQPSPLILSLQVKIFHYQ